MQQEKVSVSWTKKDAEKGYAVGNLNVIGVSVPIIIKDFKLSPLDTMILPEGTLPLNDFFLRRIYDKPEAFEGLELKRKSPYENLFGGRNSLQMSPTDEYSGSKNHISRDAVKVASVIEQLSYVDRDDVNEILQELTDPVVKRGFEKNGTLQVAKDLVNKAKQSTKTASLDDFVRNLEIDRQLIYEDTFGNKFVKQANSRFNKTWTTKIGSLEAYEMKDIIANDEKSPKITKIASDNRKSPKVIKEGESGTFVSEKNEELEKLGEIDIYNIEKLPEQEKIASLKLQNSKGNSIYITKEGNWTVGGKEKVSSLDFDELEGQEPQIGQYGVFITEKTASYPFEITGMRKQATAGGWLIKGDTDFMHKVAYYPIGVQSEGFEKHEKEKNAFYVPKNAKWVPLKEKNEKLAHFRDYSAKLKVEGLNGFNKIAFLLTDDEDAKLTWIADENAYLLPTKEAEFVENIKSVERVKNASAMLNTHEVHRDSSGFYSLRGNEFTKYAQEAPIRNLDRDSVKWSLIHCGATEDDLEKLAELKPNRSFELEGKINSPMPLSELDKNLNASMEKEAGKKLTIARLLVKEASQLSDKATVDAVLSLNLMRKRNIKDYLKTLPTLEHVLSSLSKLLIGARLGMENVDPTDVKEAVDALSQVVIQLYELQATMKKVK